MIRIKSIILIGTSHISPHSIKNVRVVIRRIKPRIVALELDIQRFNSLLYGKKKILAIKELGLRGALINAIGAYVEKKLAEIVHTHPGDEMKEAIKTAKEVKADIALIDQNIIITLKKLAERLTFKEKITLVLDIVRSLFFKQKIRFNLAKVPSKSFIKKLTTEVKKSYPTIYQVLIKERDDYMAKQLFLLAQKHPTSDIVAVVGIGHEEGILKKLKKMED